MSQAEHDRQDRRHRGDGGGGKDGDGGDGGAPMSIEELSERSGITVRTIRYYQTKKLLPPPEREGRRSWYRDQHLERLGLITQLHDRGLRLSGIAEVLRHADGQSLSVREWMGLGQALSGVWIDDPPELLTESQLTDRLGQRPGLRASLLEEVGLIERRHDTSPTTFLVTSSAMLELAIALTDVGFDVDTTRQARTILERHLGAAADELVRVVGDEVAVPRLHGDVAGEVGTLIDAVRPIALRAVTVIFAHQMKRALHEVLASGGRSIAAPPERRRRR